MAGLTERTATFDRRAFSPREVAKISGLGKTTVYDRIKSGDLAAKKSGKRTLILAEDLDRFLRSLPAAN